MKANIHDLTPVSQYPRKGYQDPVTGLQYSKLGLENLSVSAAKAIGWYEIVDNQPTLGDNEKMVKSPLAFNGSVISQNYTIIPRLSDEDYLLELREQFKASRTLIVSQIKVTVSTGKIFDGDEISQSRMARAVIASDPLETVPWVLAESISATVVTREELKEALRLAGDAQTAVWTA